MQHSERKNRDLLLSSRKKHKLKNGSTIVTLLPGSRLQEVTRMLSVFSSTMELLKSSYFELTTVIHVAPNRHVKDYISKVVDKWPVPVVLIPGEISSLKYDAFSVKSSIDKAVEEDFIGLITCHIIWRQSIMPTYFSALDIFWEGC
ncbi:hypothetical protein AgCh_032140 [Apium graveolens]